MSDKVKQVIVVRKDLNMPAGKMAAQVAHASMSFLTRGLQHQVSHASDPWNQSNWFSSPQPERVTVRTLEVDDELALWIDGSFTKIVVSVPDEETLLAIYREAGVHMCRRSLIKDEGRTVFNGIPTHTCVGIGPNYIEKVDAVTKGLPLYR